ncbi:MAG: hypothetical protein D6797_06160, partial [Bdellovibrio sp.]
MMSSKTIRHLFKKSLPYLLLGGLLFFAGFIKSYHLPKLKSWILYELERQSTKHLPLRIWPHDVNISLWPIGIKLKNIQVLPKKPLKPILRPLTLKEVKIYLSLFELVKGQIHIDELHFKKGKVHIIIPKTSSSKSPSHFFKWKWLKIIPLNHLFLEDIDLIV